MAPSLTVSAYPDPNVPRSEKLLASLMTYIRNNQLFVYCVAGPVLLAVIYFGLIASDVYVSESRFVVRSTDKQGQSPFGFMMKGTGISRSQDDSYSAQDFMTSRDALRALVKNVHIDQKYSRPGIDLISRFNSLGLNNSQEDLYLYYQRKIEIVLDSSSSITTLTTRAFSAEDAYQINLSLLEMGEELINRMNERSRQDMIRFASGEVAVAEKKAKDAAIAISSFRSTKGVVDPDRQSSIQLQQVAKLKDALITTKAQLAQLRSFAKDNPQIPSMEKRVETLQSAINAEEATTTSGAKSLAGKAVDYQRLMLEQNYADRQLASALASLDQARNEAQRQQLYLERIVQPAVPDEAIEPRRFRSVVATLVLGLIIWGILTILIAGIREHRD